MFEGTQFKSTRRWNTMIALFYRSVPRNQHRHYWKSFPNSFSGRAAVDVMVFVLADVFPERRTERSVAIKVMEKFVDHGVIVPVKVTCNTFRDEKDAFYRFGNLDDSITDTNLWTNLTAMPRRAVSLDETRNKELTRKRIRSNMSESSYGSSSPDDVSPSNSIHSICSSQFTTSKKERKSAVNAALFRFMQWTLEANMPEPDRVKLMNQFKNNYPRIYKEFIDRQDAQRDFQRLLCQLSNKSSELKKTPVHPSTVMCNNVDVGVLNAQLLSKLDQVSKDQAYSKTERQKIMRYYRRFYPDIYRQRFPEDETYALIRRLRGLLPKRSDKLRLH